MRTNSGPSWTGMIFGGVNSIGIVAIGGINSMGIIAIG